MTKPEHLAWCKTRALEYLDTGDVANAVASMGSDLNKHAETQCNPHLMAAGMLAVIQNDARAARRWIEGFN